MNNEADAAIGAVGTGASRLTGLYTKFAQKHGIQYGTIQVFYVLKFNSPVTQKQISEICEIPKQTVNGVIKQLKNDNYITLAVGEGDKREKQIVLTPLGEAHIQEALTPFFELNEMVMKRIGRKSIQQLSQNIAMLGDALELEIELKEVSSKWEEKQWNTK